MEQIYAFAHEKPETFTQLPVVNAVLEAFGNNNLHNGINLGRYLEFSSCDISADLCIITGHSLTGLRRLWTLYKAEQYRTEHPDCTEDELCIAVGYRDRRSLWQAINAPRINHKSHEWSSLSSDEQLHRLDEFIARKKDAEENAREFLKKLHSEKE